MLGIIDHIEHFWKDHKKVVIGVVAVIVILVLV